MNKENYYLISDEEAKRILERPRCDKYDYIIAASLGVLAGIVDIFFVGAPGKSVLQGTVDKSADELVKKSAQMFYKFDSRTTGKPKHVPDTLEKCISYLEQAFPVPYDARYAKDLNVAEGVLDGMTSKNHHLLSLAHSPDIIGLIFSIIDQFTSMGSFIDNGQVIRVVPKKTSGAIPYLQGTNLITRLFCGFVNWIGHMMSDLVGASSTRAPGKTGRGMGIAMPFYELLALCNLGNIDGKTISQIAISAFEEGYDARFAATMAIPVVLNDIFIRFAWAIKKHFYSKTPWKECIPTNKNDDLRLMVLVGTGSMCAVDGLDAGIRSGGNAVFFVTRLNIVAWGKLAIMGIKEILIRYNCALDDVTIKPFLQTKQLIVEYLEELEKIDIDLFEKETNSFEEFTTQIIEAKDDNELNKALFSTIEKMGLSLPWEGDFDEFMSDEDTTLVFE